ncbi:hypothetical protein DB347_24045 [Opitutaceae bacterium EW11]|nr:hypothetical protein DB347_24045 [Opitutaceae bacterium EW11]
MTQDPNAEFDQSVLELIERSPTGVVPHTPSHQDSLRRLRAAHQVYPSADHENGFVTARSLAGRQTFQAANLDVLRSSADDDLEPNAAVFDRYVKSLPPAQQARAESFRAMVAGRPAHHRAKHGLPAVHDPVHSLFLLPGGGPHPGLPGDYLYGFVAQHGGPAPVSAAWSIHLHDRQDGEVLWEGSDIGEALDKLEELLACAPFDMAELEALGFRFT